jgi:hypothetical protein
MPEIDLTLPAILAGGAVAASAFITGLVEVIKKLVPLVGRHQWEPQLAAIFAAVLVMGALTGVEPKPESVNEWAAFALSGVLSWYGITRLALGIHDDVTQAPGSLTGVPTAGTTTGSSSPPSAPIG